MTHGAGEVKAMAIECRACKLLMRPLAGDGDHRSFECDGCGAAIEVTYKPLSAKLDQMRPRKQGIT